MCGTAERINLNYWGAKMKLQTVNVIEYDMEEGTVLCVHSFTDNEEGNKEAEELFSKLAKEMILDADDEDIETSIENGYIEGDRTVNDYQVFITHSS